MGEFRRFIIGTAETMQVIAVVLGTLGAGFVGKLYAQLVALGAGSQNTGGYEFLGFVVGAAIGFVIAATAAAVFFMLSETAANTRQMAMLMERTSNPVRTSPSGSPHWQTGSPASGIVAEHSQSTHGASATSTKFSEPLNQPEAFPDPGEVQDIIRKAEAAGFTVALGNYRVLFKQSGRSTYCYSSKDLQAFCKLNGI